ncbi:MAG: L-2-amino-thiazoline-4-carboxylic acid hydrolase [Methanomassiliicoccales archaeon]|nr:L-2-amino-thiazoline-4-carboxylic acid hydrolase [Methanomassiliicoccales archaeon]MDD1756112.1 L-2-amino-thiazoline-4-carboxylic acid hydrolase [Methanomassiliicoccales archaeon]
MKDDDVYTKLAKLAAMMSYFWGAEPKSIRLIDGELVVESEKCVFQGTLPMICECYCNIARSAAVKEIDTDMELESIPGSVKHDPRCIVRNHHPTRTLLSGFSNREYDVGTILGQISEDEMRWRSHEFSGGVWMMLTYAMVNSLGPERMLNILSSQMRRNGFALGLRIKRDLGIEGSESTSMLDALELFSRAVLQKHTVLTNEPDKIEVEVDGCIWCGHDYSTPEHCQLIEAINDSICKSINPDYEFRYLTMRTRGDDRCVWTVQKGSSKLKERPSNLKEVPPELDPLSLLKLRLAKGELSLDEYRLLRDALTE